MGIELSIFPKYYSSTFIKLYRKYLYRAPYDNGAIAPHENGAIKPWKNLSNSSYFDYLYVMLPFDLKQLIGGIHFILMILKNFSTL